MLAEIDSPDIARAREQAHALLDYLSADKVGAVRGLLVAMVDPVDRTKALIPDEDEEIGEAEERAVAEAREWLKHNNAIPMEAVLSEFGLTMADFEQMARSARTPETARVGTGDLGLYHRS